MQKTVLCLGLKGGNLWTNSLNHVSYGLSMSKDRIR